MLLGIVVIIEPLPTIHLLVQAFSCIDTFIQDMPVGQAVAYKRAEPCLLVSTNRVKATMNWLFDKRGKGEWYEERVKKRKTKMVIS